MILCLCLIYFVGVTMLAAYSLTFVRNPKLGWGVEFGICVLWPFVALIISLSKLTRYFKLRK
jgi:hypothetical protein